MGPGRWQRPSDTFRFVCLSVAPSESLPEGGASENCQGNCQSRERARTHLPRSKQITISVQQIKKNDKQEKKSADCKMIQCRMMTKKSEPISDLIQI